MFPQRTKALKLVNMLAGVFIAADWYFQINISIFRDAFQIDSFPLRHVLPLHVISYLPCDV